MIVSAVIDRFEGEKAVLLIGDMTTVVWPREYLPEYTSEGDVIKISLVADDGATRNAKKQAENLLRQVLENQEE